ncbi:MAG TPA: hypothetical protein VNR65_07945 [Geobacterales bacterium]|jgi:hypothetical protein|nr:hypothetical protein [Geobacterales bacterium]
MDQAQVLSRQERFKLALEKFCRAHIVDDDPYDALENERFEALISARQAAEKDASAIEDLPLAA